MFKNPLQDKPKQNDQVPYDERSGCHVNRGTENGSGHRNPVGSTGSPKQFVDTLPQTSMTKTIKGCRG